MSETAVKEQSATGSGWRPMPLPLKIIFVLLVLWMVGSVMNLPNLYENGMPLFGNFVYGVKATLLPLLVDIIGPLIFLFALWYRKPWAALWAFAYNGIFIVNNVVAFFTVREQLGVPQIVGPTVVSLVFVAIIFWKRHYFRKAP